MTITPALQKWNFYLIMIKEYFYEKKSGAENSSVSVFEQYKVNKSIHHPASAKAEAPIRICCLFEPGYPVSRTCDIPNVKRPQCVRVPLSSCPLYGLHGDLSL